MVWRARRRRRRLARQTKKIVKTSCLLSGGILPGSGAGPGVNPGANLVPLPDQWYLTSYPYVYNKGRLNRETSTSLWQVCDYENLQKSIKGSPCGDFYFFWEWVLKKWEKCITFSFLTVPFLDKKMITLQVHKTA